jgi:hypothetical protein
LFRKSKVIFVVSSGGVWPTPGIFDDVAQLRKNVLEHAKRRPLPVNAKLCLKKGKSRKGRACS